MILSKPTVQRTAALLEIPKLYNQWLLFSVRGKLGSFVGFRHGSSAEKLRDRKGPHDCHSLLWSVSGTCRYLSR